ncbi:organic hydroperoxide resistance protein [Hamadaea tsunoensis]|uniref:organic hydroperoxide resistance protein n=1 Tax=Hamadaea tsunoensis TaxID=53368 RepID=UPI00040480F7|nr:organic hydroperoxide resistance protein [Hamadaea tsunoensis]
MKTLYTAEAVATGDGRNGHARTSDGILDLDLAVPKEMGGAGGAANPELLFAAGYAACLHSALKAVARLGKVQLPETTVTARVSIGGIGDGRYGLAVELLVRLPGMPADDAERLVARAHEVCPYSNATRGNIEVSLVTEV